MSDPIIFRATPPPTFISIPSERLQELEDQVACDLATIVDLRNQITRLNKIIDGLLP